MLTCKTVYTQNDKLRFYTDIELNAFLKKDIKLILKKKMTAFKNNSLYS